jgi:hypothetical protein
MTVLAYFASAPMSGCDPVKIAVYGLDMPPNEGEIIPPG